MTPKPEGTLRLLAAFLVAWAPVLIDPGAPGEAAALFSVAETGNPWLVPRHALLLYVRFPLVTLSASILLLSPGLILALGRGRDQSMDGWVLRGFGISLVLVGVITSSLTALGIAPFGRGFSALLIAASLAAVAVVMRPGRPASFVPPRELKARAVLSYLGPPLLLLACLAPKFLWESLNGDGAHALEASRLLLGGPLPGPLPFWDPAAGAVSRFPGLNSMLFTFPASWFMRMLGDIEAAVRVPFILYLVALYAAISGLARTREDRRLGNADRWLVWLGLGAYALAMAFSATYNPYHADIALPGAQDTLFLACFLGFVYAFVREESSWMVLFFALTVVSLASWLVLLGLWLGAVLLVWRPLPRRSLLLGAGLIVGSFIVLSFLPPVLARLSLPVPGAEHSSGELLERLQFLRFDEWRRWLYLVVPAGILPVAFLFGWRRQDHVARALTVVTAGYFLFFYVQAFTSLHHYLPAAVLALAVMWRSREAAGDPRRFRGAVLATGVLALILSLPAHGGIHLQGRHVGYAVDDRREGYAEFDPGVFASADLYWELFRRVVSRDVPREAYGGSPLVWNYYANHRPATVDRTTYLFLPVSQEPPPDAVLMGEQGSARMYVRDTERWTSDRTFGEPSSVGRIFAIPKRVLFRAVGENTDSSVVDLGGIIRRLKGNSR